MNNILNIMLFYGLMVYLPFSRTACFSPFFLSIILKMNHILNIMLSYGLISNSSISSGGILYLKRLSSPP